MKHFSILILSLLCSLTGYSVEIQTHVSEVTIYHSGALVNRWSDYDLKTGVSEITLTNVSKKMVLSSLSITNPEITILNKTLTTKMTPAEYNILLDKKEALTKQLQLIDLKYEEVGFISDVGELEKMTSFYLEKTVSIKQSLRAIEEKIEESKRLDNIDLKDENSAILTLLVSAEKSLNEVLALEYVCGGIGWSPSYTIKVEDASSSELNLKYMARVMSQTGETWTGVTVHLSSSFPLESPTDLPSAKNPWVLKKGNFNLTNTEDASYQTTPNLGSIEALQGVNYETINVPYYLEKRTLEGEFTIKPNSTVFTFPILTKDLPAKYFYYGFPSLDPFSYLVCEIKGWSTLGLVDGIASINYRGNDLGRTILRFSETEEALLLPIGKDNSVFLERTEITDKNYFKESSVGKKKKNTLAYRYTVKNNNQFPIKFELAEQVPVSQSKEASVEIIDFSGASIDKESGDVNWNLNLEPNSALSKELIFTIEIDSKYSYNSNSRSQSRFRSISCPSF